MCDDNVLRHIAKLRRDSLIWRRRRWTNIAFGSLMVGMCVWALHKFDSSYVWLQNQSQLIGCDKVLTDRYQSSFRECSFYYNIAIVLLAVYCITLCVNTVTNWRRSDEYSDLADRLTRLSRREQDQHDSAGNP